MTSLWVSLEERLPISASWFLIVPLFVQREVQHHVNKILSHFYKKYFQIISLWAVFILCYKPNHLLWKNDCHLTSLAPWQSSPHSKSILQNTQLIFYHLYLPDSEFWLSSRHWYSVSENCIIVSPQISNGYYGNKRTPGKRTYWTHSPSLPQTHIPQQGDMCKDISIQR